MQHELGSEALSFLRDELSYGGSLAERLASIPLKGRIVAILPAGTAPADLTDLGSGGVATGDEVHEFADIVRARISRGTNSVCVFEHPTLRVGDPRMPSLDYFTVGESVYPYPSSGSNHEAIVKAARETHWYPSIGVISGLDEGLPIPEPGSALTESLLEDLVAHVDLIVVGAYDAESWIVWNPELGHEQHGEVSP